MAAYGLWNYSYDLKRIHLIVTIFITLPFLNWFFRDMLTFKMNLWLFRRVQ